MEKRFSDFNEVSLSEFEAQLVKDLRGKPLEFLTTQPEEGLDVKAYSHSENNISTNNLAGLRKIQGWVIRKEISPSTSNAEVLELLNNGVSGLGLTFESVEKLNSQSKAVLFEHLHADLELSSADASNFHDIDQNIRLNFDPIANALTNGQKITDLKDYSNFVERYNNHNSISIDGSIYGDAGASSLQELAYTLGHYNEYLNALTEGQDASSIETFIKKSFVSLSITENYFVNIAKFRAIRILVKALFEGYDYKGDEQPLIGAKSSSRSFALNDANNNLLRATTQGMSAVLGGCDVLTLKSEELKDEKLSLIHERVVKNISLVLQEEAHLDKVSDPGAGSYYIEKITNQLVEKAWALFQQLENDGGLIEAINSNRVQNDIQMNAEKLIANVNSKATTLLGINKFQSSVEEYQTVSLANSDQGEIKSLKALKLEAHYSPVEA